MTIGNCIVEIYIPDTSSIKEKRNIIKALKDRIRNKFNVSISQIDTNNNHRISILAIAAVANERNYVNRLLSNVVKFMEKQRTFEIVKYKKEMF